ncbi:hydrolase [Oscillibacter sp.]|uniref:XkdQ/YqbQ family protein n=1 Tax=Oscillibacter sp. TaxID=1945593 RepID=UPI00263754A8|nr:hydrolase [Oscillibacter sp.]MDD3347332.1 hydrolase [Oscillibacter sp.]
MTVELLIQNGSKIYQPAVVEGISLTTERKGTPGKLTFDVVKDASLNFQEGNAVRFTVDGTKMFYGFVFIKKRSKANTISVTAYDQLRYLKNKDTITYEGKKASEVVKMLADDFNLQCGTLEDTGYVIESAVEENTGLFDMIQNALDVTLRNTKKLYVLYDDFGKLTLKNVESMKLDLLIDAETAEDFDYASSIDDQTYNKIKLIYDNDKTGKREIYIAQDGSNINNWGVLQYHEALQNNTGAAARATALLGLYDKKTRTLTVKNAFGDPRVHAGCAVVVNLNLGDIITKNYMVVQKVKHTFTESEHLMDLTLIGGEFIA